MDYGGCSAIDSEEQVKRKHAGAQSRKHGCCRCGKHKSKVLTLRQKTGKLYSICEPCMKASGGK